MVEGPHFSNQGVVTAEEGRSYSSGHRAIGKMKTAGVSGLRSALLLPSTQVGASRALDDIAIYPGFRARGSKLPRDSSPWATNLPPRKRGWDGSAAGRSPSKAGRQALRQGTSIWPLAEGA